MVTLDLWRSADHRPERARLVTSGPFADGVALGDDTKLVARALRLAGAPLRSTSTSRSARWWPGGGSPTRPLPCGGPATATGPAASIAAGADIPFVHERRPSRVRGHRRGHRPAAFSRWTSPGDPPLRVSTLCGLPAWDRLGGRHHHGANDLEAAAIAVRACPGRVARTGSPRRSASPPTLAAAARRGCVEGTTTQPCAAPAATVGVHPAPALTRTRNVPPAQRGRGAGASVGYLAALAVMARAPEHLLVLLLAHALAALLISEPMARETLPVVGPRTNDPTVCGRDRCKRPR